MAKKYLTSVILTIFILIGLIQTGQASPIVIMNGNILSFNVPPVVEKRRILVPLRPISEALGATVSWDNETKTVTAIKGVNSVKLQIGSSTATKNGLIINLDAPGKIINGTTFVPVRFVSETMECTVVWVDEYQMVVITDNNLNPIKVYSDLKKNMQGAIVPAISMMPTICMNDRVLIDKHIYSVIEPKRGDIIMFLPPKEINTSEKYLKRIVGLPGDTIATKKGQLYINDQVYIEAYILEPMDYEFGPINVPSDNYFVLGDNRNQSFDSHCGWFVPKSNIIGKAQSVYWPVERQKSL